MPSAPKRNQQNRPQRKNPECNTNWYKFLRPARAAKMVEAVYECSPDYFKHFQKHFKCQIVNGTPTFSNANSFAVWNKDLQFMTNHYHVLIDTTTFRSEFLETKGDLFSRFNSAAEFNDSAEKKIDSNNTQKTVRFAKNNWKKKQLR